MKNIVISIGGLQPLAYTSLMAAKTQPRKVPGTMCRVEGDTSVCEV
jgi:hypothetical protein